MRRLDMVALDVMSDRVASFVNQGERSNERRSVSIGQDQVCRLAIGVGHMADHELKLTEVLRSTTKAADQAGVHPMPEQVHGEVHFMARPLFQEVRQGARGGL